MPPVDLGQVTFGLGANTAGLNRAVQDMFSFGQQVNQVARQTDEASRRMTQAFARQEVAMRQALQQTLNLNAAVSRSGAPPELLARNVRAFQGLTRVMTDGVVNTVNYGRAQDKFAAQLGKSSRSLKDFNANLRSKDHAAFTTFMRDLESSAVLAVGPLSGLGARIRALSAITSRSTLTLAGWLAGITGTVIALAALSVGAVKAGRAMESIDSVLRAATGSTAGAALEFEFVHKTATDLGIAIDTAALAYGKLAAATRGTTAEGQGTRDVFLGVSQAAVALKLNADQVELSFRALQQIASKGVVSMEDLRGQFSEHIPGGLRIAAQALGVTTSQLEDMVRKGNVLAEDFLPKLGRELQRVFAEDATRSAASLQSTLGRLGNATFDFSIRLNEALGILDTFKGVVNAITSVVTGATDNFTTLAGSIGAVTGAVLLLSSPGILRGIVFLATQIRNLAIFLGGSAFIAGLATFGGWVPLLVRLGVAAVGAAGGFYLFGRAVESTKGSNEEFIGQIDEFIDRQNKLVTATRSATDQLITETQKRIEAIQLQITAEQTLIELSGRQAEIRPLSGFQSFLQFTPILGDVVRFFQSIGATDPIKEATEAIARYSAELAKFQARLEALKGVKAIEIAAGPRELSKEGKKAVEQIQDMIAELDTFEKQMQAARKPGATEESLKVIKDLADAMKLLKDVPKTELDALTEALGGVALAGDTTLESVARLITLWRRGGDGSKEAADRVKELSKALTESKTVIADLQGKTFFAGIGTDATEMLRKFEKELDKREAIEKFTQSLEKAGAAQADINGLVVQFGEAWEAADVAEERMKKIRSMAEDLADAFKVGFDQIGDWIEQAFEQGSDAAFDFGKLVTSVLGSVARKMLEITLINPLVKIGTSFLEGLIGSAVGSAATGVQTVGAGPSAGAGAQHGAIIKGGSALITAGSVHPVAEAGSEEAIMPLTRLPSGRLGVGAVGGGASGGGGGTVVNIYNNTDSQATVRRQKDSQGNERIDVILDRQVAGAVRGGGHTYRAIKDVFGVQQSVAGR